MLILEVFGMCEFLIL